VEKKSDNKANFRCLTRRKLDRAIKRMTRLLIKKEAKRENTKQEIGRKLNVAPRGGVLPASTP